MPIVLPLLSLALAVSAAAPTTPPALTARTRDGATIKVERPVTGPRSFLVEFRDAPRGTRATIERFRADLGRRTPRAQSATPVTITCEYVRAFHGVAAVLDDADAQAIRRFAYVKAVHEDTPMRAFAGNDEDRTRLARIGAERVWAELGTRGRGVDVAVIDTGVDYTHPALASRYAGGWDFVADDDDPMDEHGHGTHVAGIIAGTTADVAGVAPEARVFAYRVLDRFGTGNSSAIIAAIERAVDPNQDGDFADRVDIINLSLGGGGDADHPTSVAVDRAVAAGVVVCMAAGNTPGGQTVGSPGSARLGITVGSSDPHDVFALYSSRGPAYPDFHVKPEIVAPGNAIRSAKLGGGTVLATGTSMASPHAAGAAALLLALHRDWTPAQVKAALIATARAVAAPKETDADVMSQGAGRIDVYAAARTSSAIEPAVVGLGRNATGADWAATRTVRLTNRSSRAQTFRAATPAAAGIDLTVTPAELTLEPGASADVTISAAIADNANPSRITLSHGGLVSFTSEEGTTVLPWASVEGALVTVNAEDFSSQVIWSCDSGVALLTRVGVGKSEALLPHGRCDLIATFNYFDLGVVLQPHVIDGDRELTVDRAQAPHAVRVAGVDREGKPIGKDSYTAPAYYAQYVIELPESSPFRGMDMITFTNRPLYVSDLPDGATLGAAEVLYDFGGKRIVGIQHQRVSAVRGDVTMSSLPSDLHHARLEIGPRRGNLAGLTSIAVDGLGYSMYLASYGVPLAQGWSGDVYVTEDPSGAVIFAPGVHTEDYPDVQLDVASLGIRAIDGRIVFSNDRVPAPSAHGVPEGGTLRVGDVPISPRTFVDPLGSTLRMSLANVGPAGEYRYGLTAFDYELRRAGGELAARGRADSPFVEIEAGERGPYKLDLRTQRLSQLSLTFDTSREDSNPPTLTWFRIDDGSLLFSTADYQLTPEGAECLELRATRAYVRAGGGAWRELPLSVVVNDRGENLGHFETGTLYRTAVGEIGVVDVRIEMEDLAGNTSVVTLENVLGAPLRRRAA